MSISKIISEEYDGKYQLVIKDADLYNEYRNRNLEVLANKKAVRVNDTLMKDLLSNKVLYDELINNIEDGNSEGIHLLYFDETNPLEPKIIEYSVAEIVAAFMSRDINFDSKYLSSKAGIENLTNFYELNKEYRNKKVYYFYEGRHYSVDISELIKLVTLTDSDIENMKDDEDIIKLCLLVSVFEQYKILDRFILDDEMVERYEKICALKKVKDKETSIELMYTSDDIEEANVEDSIIENIFEGYSRKYSKMEYAIYVYITMSLILEVSEEYSSDLKVSLDNRCTNKENFISILTLLLRKNHINFDICECDDLLEGVTSVIVHEGEYDVKFTANEATFNIVKNDNNQLVGIECLNTSETTIRKLNEIVNKIKLELDADRNLYNVFYECLNESETDYKSRGIA